MIKQEEQAKSSIKKPEDLTPSELVEMAISHILKICANHLQDCLKVRPKYLWKVLKSLISLWKQVCVLLASNKAVYNIQNLQAVSRNLFKCHHLVIQTLAPDEKMIFFSDEGVFHSEPSTDVVWIPKAIELVTPYLKDENK